MVYCCSYRHQCRRLCAQSPVGAFYCTSLHSPYGFHMESTRTPPGLHLLTLISPSPKSCYNPLHIYSLWTPCGLHEEWSGVEWRTLEKDWRWTEGGLHGLHMDWRRTGGGLHKDPWGSVRYSNQGPPKVAHNPSTHLPPRKLDPGHTIIHRGN